MFLSPLGERLGEGVQPEDSLLHHPLTQPLPQGGEELENKKVRWSPVPAERLPRTKSKGVEGQGQFLRSMVRRNSGAKKNCYSLLTLTYVSLKYSPRADRMTTPPVGRGSDLARTPYRYGFSGGDWQNACGNCGNLHETVTIVFSITLLLSLSRPARRCRRGQRWRRSRRGYNPARAGCRVHPRRCAAHAAAAHACWPAAGPGCWRPAYGPRRDR